MLAHTFAFFLLLLQTPRAPRSRHPTCVVTHGEIEKGNTYSVSHGIVMKYLKSHIKCSEYNGMRGLPRSLCLTAWEKETKPEYRDGNIQYYWHYIDGKLCFLKLLYLLKMDPENVCPTIKFSKKMLFWLWRFLCVYYK